jgi:hypothetical protein
MTQSGPKGGGKIGNRVASFERDDPRPNMVVFGLI